MIKLDSTHTMINNNDLSNQNKMIHEIKMKWNEMKMRIFNNITNANEK